jgi:hypothetical protein
MLLLVDAERVDSTVLMNALKGTISLAYTELSLLPTRAVGSTWDD